MNYFKSNSMQKNFNQKFCLKRKVGSQVKWIVLIPPNKTIQ